MPAEYPPWQSLYRWFRRWQRDGVWARLFASLQARADEAGVIGWTVSVDSTISRAPISTRRKPAVTARRRSTSQRSPP
nr:transposase [Micromonospora sp. KC207]